MIPFVDGVIPDSSVDKVRRRKNQEVCRIESFCVDALPGTRDQVRCRAGRGERVRLLVILPIGAAILVDRFRLCAGGFCLHLRRNGEQVIENGLGLACPDAIIQ